MVILEKELYYIYIEKYLKFGGITFQISFSIKLLKVPTAVRFVTNTAVDKS